MATDSKSGTHADGAPKGAFPPFQKDTFGSQLLWFAIAFLLLYVLLARVALPKMAKVFAERAQHIEDDLKKAERLRIESEAALAAYETSLAEARGRALAIAAKNQEQLAAKAEKQRKILETQLADQLADAERQIAATKNAAMANVQQIAVDIAEAIVRQLLGTAAAKADIERAVQRALN